MNKYIIEQFSIALTQLSVLAFHTVASGLELPCEDIWNAGN